MVVSILEEITARQDGVPSRIAISRATTKKETVTLIAELTVDSTVLTQP